MQKSHKSHKFEENFYLIKGHKIAKNGNVFKNQIIRVKNIKNQQPQVDYVKLLDEKTEHGKNIWKKLCTLSEDSAYRVLVRIGRDKKNYKTAPCHEWINTGNCNVDDCKHAHDLTNLTYQRIPNPDTYKTEECKQGYDCTHIGNLEYFPAAFAEVFCFFKHELEASDIFYTEYELKLSRPKVAQYDVMQDLGSPLLSLSIASSIQSINFTNNRSYRDHLGSLCEKSNNNKITEIKFEYEPVAKTSSSDNPAPSLLFYELHKHSPKDALKVEIRNNMDLDYDTDESDFLSGVLSPVFN